MVQPRVVRARSLVLLLSITCILILMLSRSLGRGYFSFEPQKFSKAENDWPQISLPASQGSMSFISRTRDGIPIYNSSEPSSIPRFLSVASAQPAFFAGSSLENLKVLSTHPRLFARLEKWESLGELTKKDAYLSSWNQTIFEIAEQHLSQPPPIYVLDGTNGVLDIARVVQLRIKLWSYAYRLSGGNVKWKDLVWNEVMLASGNSSQHFGPSGDNWNSGYVLCGRLYRKPWF